MLLAADGFGPDSVCVCTVCNISVCVCLGFFLGGGLGAQEVGSARSEERGREEEKEGEGSEEHERREQDERM